MKTRNVSVMSGQCGVGLTTLMLSKMFVECVPYRFTKQNGETTKLRNKNSLEHCCFISKDVDSIEFFDKLKSHIFRTSWTYSHSDCDTDAINDCINKSPVSFYQVAHTDNLSDIEELIVRCHNETGCNHFYLDSLLSIEDKFREQSYHSGCAVRRFKELAEQYGLTITITLQTSQRANALDFISVQQSANVNFEHYTRNDGHLVCSRIKWNNGVKTIKSKEVFLDYETCVMRVSPRLIDMRKES